jgi:hypothetical protein
MNDTPSADGAGGPISATPTTGVGPSPNAGSAGAPVSKPPATPSASPGSTGRAASLPEPGGVETRQGVTGPGAVGQDSVPADAATEASSDATEDANAAAKPVQIEGENRGSFTDKAEARTLAFEPIDAFVRPNLADPRLWGALIEAVSDLGAPATPPPGFGVVLSEEPLLGLAVVAALGRGEARVPVFEDARNRALPFETIVSQHPLYSLFCESVGRQPPRGYPLLMLGWAASGEQLLRDVRSDLPISGECDPVICLMQSPPHGAVLGDLVLVDVPRRAEEILARAVVSLGLPKRNPCVDIEVAAKLIRDMIDAGRLIDIVAALNTKENHKFESLALDVALGANTQSPLRGKISEATPRESASLFVASHFEGLAPETFLDLADTLAQRGPQRRLPEHRTRPPAVVTDEVLAACEIKFALRADKVTQFCVFDGDNLEPAEAQATGVILRRTFSDRAPLLKERYLQILAARMTLGHPSGEIASTYAILEREALRAAWSQADPYLGHQRLRRIVFGFPAAPTLGVAAPQGGQRQFGEAFELAVLRAPQFIRDWARRDSGPPGADQDAFLATAASGITLAEAVEALSVAEPADGNEAWREAFHHAAANIFWSLYGAGDDAAPFTAFLPWTAPGLSAAERRRIAMEILGDVLAEGTAQGMASGAASRYRDPATVSMLLADVAVHFDAMLRVDTERSQPVILLSRTAAAYVQTALSSRPWPKVRDWRALGRDDASVAALARAMFSLDMGAWLLAPRDVAEGEAASVEEGRDIWLALRTTLEALTGVSAYGALEPEVISRWLLDHGRIAASFDSVALWMVERDSRGRDNFPDFLAAIRPLAVLFPVVVLMAATVSPAADGADLPRFGFGPDLRAWLGEQTAAGFTSRGAEVLERIRLGLELQRQWSASQQGLGLRLSDPGGVAAMSRDRFQALRAFADAIRRAVRPVPSSDQT